MNKSNLINTNPTNVETASSSEKEKKDEIKFRNFEIVNNINDNFDVHKFEALIRSNKKILKYAFIIHDQDYTDETKTQKKNTHYHLMCACDNTYRASTISNWFNTNPNQVQRIKSNFPNALLYLTHLNAPEKHQYEDTEVYSNFSWQKERKKAKSKIINQRQKAELIRAILDGQVKQYNIYEYFTTNEIDNSNIIYWDRDIKTAFKHRAEFVTLNPNRNLQTWFIQGKSGVGKTVLAKILAEKKGYKPFVTGSGNDALDGYGGQECIILDECRDDTFKTYDDLLKMTDKHTASRFRSRFQNKVLTEVKLIIITSTQTYEEIFCNPYRHEEDKQIKRRISTLLKVDKEGVIVKQFNEETNTFEILTCFANPLENYLKTTEQNREQETPQQLKNWFEQTFIETEEKP